MLEVSQMNCIITSESRYCGYGLDDRGIVIGRPSGARWGVYLLQIVLMVSGTHPASRYMVTLGSLPVRKATGAWVYIHATARLVCTNIPMRYTVYEMMMLMMDW